MITKTEFISLLSALQNQIDEDSAFAQSCTDYFGARMINNCNLDLIKAVVDFIDTQSGCCNYVGYWVFVLDFGRKKNPNRSPYKQSEMDFELDNVRTSEDLYDFILTKQK